MELRDALAQISEIREQIARTQVFRGYRPLTVAASGAVAFAAAGWQAAWVPQPMIDLDRYLFVWWTAAVVSVVAVAAEVVLDCRGEGAELQREKALLAARQFVPFLATGFLLTFVVMRFATPDAWMFPGLWAVILGLGVFSSRPVLPGAATAIIGGFYLLAGLVCLAVGRGPAALSPWAMGLTFGVGQLSAAAVLYLTLERNDGGTDAEVEDAG